MITEINLEVNFIAQSRFDWCWAATLEMVWNFHNEKKSQEYWVQQLGFQTKEDQGIDVSTFNKLLSSNQSIIELKCFFGTNLQDVRFIVESLINKVPVIAMYNESNKTAHCVLIVGVSMNKGLLRLNDPARGVVELEFNELLAKNLHVWTYKLSRINNQ